MRFLLALLLAAPVAAQTITGSVVGTVTDASGGVVRAAQVTLTNIATAQVQNATTDELGNYVFPLVAPGAYRVAVEAPGFKRFSRDFTLAVDQRARVNAALEVGQVTETVSVVGQAVLLETDTSSLGHVISNRQFNDLPLNGRNPFALAGLAPGVTPLASFGIGLTGGRGALIAAAANNFLANGGLTGTNEILLDGVPVTVCCQGQPALIPFIDNTEEFKVQTNASQAEFGRTSGAILNIATRSGSNELHGSAFEFLRNEKLDANNFFSNRAGRPPIPGRADLRPPLRYNQYGFAIGGPIVIPRLYSGKNKTFFFGGYEGIKLRRGVFRTFNVPTARMRQGDFSQSPSEVYDPQTTGPDPARPGQFLRGPFQNRTIPSNRFNPVALNILKLYPLPIRDGIVNNFDAVASQPDDDRQGTVRLDHNFSDKYRAFARFSLSDNDHFEPNYWGTIASPAGFNQFITGKNFVWDNVVTFSPALLANFRYGFAWQTNYRDPFSLGVDLEALGFPRSFVSQVQERFLPAQGVTGFNGPDETGNQKWSRYTHSLAAAFTWIRPKHTIKFGWDGRLYRDHNFAVGSPSGNFSYGTTFTSGPDPRAGVPAGAPPYLAFASFLLGLPTGGTHQFTDATSMQLYYSAWYIQDDWKLTPKLTLNLGLRYELETGPTERYDRYANFDPSVPHPLARQTGLPLFGAVRFMGRDGLPRNRWKTDANNWAPRVGLAYMLTKKTVLRGGYGLFYLPTTQRIFGSGNPGFVQTTPFLATTDGVTPVGSLSNPFPSGLNPPLGASLGPLTGIGTGISANLYDTPAAYVQQWNFNIQRELPGNTEVDVAYAGNHGVKLPLNLALNGVHPGFYGRPGDAARVAELDRLVSNPFFGLIQTGPLSTPQVRLNLLQRAHSHFTGVTLNHIAGGSDTYHSFQLRVQKRMSSGVTAIVAYTVAKNIGDVNQLTTSFLFPAQVGYQNDFNLRNERSLLPTDVPQRFAAGAVWDLPLGRGRRLAGGASPLVNHLVGGWQLNGILTLQSGFPLSLSAAGLPAYAGPRPSRVAGQKATTVGDVVDRLGPPSTELRYINAAAFRTPASFEFGDVPRLLPDLRNAGIRDVTLSVIKNFTLHEKMRLQFRAEAFNFFNTPRFGNPGTSLGVPAFGVIGAQENLARQVQVALKLIW